MKGRLLNWSFHWNGWNKQGISKWSGSITSVLWISRIFCVYGPIAGAMGLLALLHAYLTGDFSGGHFPLMLVGLIHGLVFTGAGLWAKSMHRFVSRLSRADDISADLGVDETHLRELAEQRNIRPRIILNDQPYFDASDFSDAMSLLRAGSRPQEDLETLVRAASGTSNSEAQTLLRAEPKSCLPPTEEREETVQNTVGS